MESDAPLILTLALDERSSAFFESQRKRHFPAHRNFIPAHLTLFHRLPADHTGSISRDLADLVENQAPFSLDVTGLRSLGRGVAYQLTSTELDGLRGYLAHRWAAWLQPQDRQRHRPHITIQNKVDPDTAKDLLAHLSADFQPFTATATGLNLWKYLGGPWDRLRQFPFSAR
ncbi:2'-5' RNA ligase family protein [Microvirga rosea]|uniref:2'-5' RNA ligase family protein n=1 Tax=Microvirga rosea TaxID=2715425 RepID=UPI0029CAC217|nr:2'-5' RNA ligase family protein [Microvirga rosea]